MHEDILPLQIYLVRHPPPIGVEGICYGRLEVPVDEQKLGATVDAVRAQIPASSLTDLPIHSSPASRCMGLARCLASPHRPISSDELLEMDFGHWQGMAWDAIARAEIDAWAKDLWDYRPGGGESATMVARRWERWLNRMRGSDCRAVIAVTHAGVIRVALASGGASPRSAALEAHIPFGSVHHLEFAP